MTIRISAVFAAVLVLLPFSARAEIPLVGSFIARKACPATQNIKAGDNPGKVMTEVGRAYPILAKNREKATHYWIVTKGPEPVRRWVAVSCGDHMVRADTAADNDNGPVNAGPAAAPPDDQLEFLLAASWEPAFCQTHQQKPECVSQSEDRFDATHLSLHGLWPQPYGNFYCGVPADQKALDEAKRYDELAALDLSPETRAALERVMPGTQSLLQRHEWTKHGSCFANSDQDGYFRASLALMEALNASPVRDLLAANIGKRVSGKAIRAAFDEAFGQGAGSRVALDCSDDLIGELRIALRGDATKEGLADLIHAAHPVPPEASDCDGGIVDRAGF